MNCNHDSHIKADEDELKMLFITSFRYAITRRSYIPFVVSNLINRNKEIFNRNILELFIKEIDEEKDILDDYEKEIWLYLSDTLKEYLDKTE